MQEPEVLQEGRADGLTRSRYDALPRYVDWQNKHRPEDSGRADGLAGLPSSSAESAEYENQIKDYLGSKLASTRNKYAAEVSAIDARVKAIEPEYTYFRKLLEDKRAEASRPLLVYLSPLRAQLMATLLSLSSAVLLYLLWRDKGISPIDSGIISIVGMMLISVVAYTCGMALRQAALRWQKQVAAGFVGTLFVAVVVVIAKMEAHSFEMPERTLIGIMTGCAVLMVAAAAFLARDTDAAYDELTKTDERLRPELAQLASRREEARVFYTNIARRHVEIAQRVIAVYRQSNIHARQDKFPPPPFFAKPPSLPNISDNWLQWEDMP